jgi:hypothetical protein
MLLVAPVLLWCFGSTNADLLLTKKNQQTKTKTIIGFDMPKSAALLFQIARHWLTFSFSAERSVIRSSLL